MSTTIDTLLANEHIADLRRAADRRRPASDILFRAGPVIRSEIRREIAQRLHAILEPGRQGLIVSFL